MVAILGIDAAWTSKQPSGLALVEQKSGRWLCRGIAPSYLSFITLSYGKAIDWHSRPTGSMPNAKAILDASKRILHNKPVDIVTVDMPISTVEFSSRRIADEKVSRAFGGLGCSTHSPTEERPGLMGKTISSEFVEMGFTIATEDTPQSSKNCIVEVYPHPAIIKLLNIDYRLEYKTLRSRQFWPRTRVRYRIEKLVQQFNRIFNALSTEIECIPDFLPNANTTYTLTGLKKYEDVLDALVCAWVGIKYYEGSAEPFGDNTAAIWIPV
ncbi:DUF429 domain-containing protein [bacterium]|nr:DUF429 domain-containing protein [bacterium]